MSEELLKNINVLYVEDEDDVRDFTGTIIKHRTKDIELAQNGLIGLEKFKERFEDDTKEDFDIVITDINMPKMNGLDMLVEIRKIDSSVPIVITTAHGGLDFLKQAISLGVRGYAMKPVDLRELIKSITIAVEPRVLQKELEHNNKKLEKEKQKAQTALKTLEEQRKQHEEDIIKNTKFSIVGQMAAGITHEINTPLTYIKGTMEMSKYDVESMPDSEIKTRLLEDNKKVMDGIDRMRIIVESMREVSQKSTGEKVEVNVYSTLITVLGMIYNRSKQISDIYVNGELFDLETSNKEKYQFVALIHKQRIEQVWTIVLNNALDELVKVNNFNDRRIDIKISKDDDKVEVKFQDNAGGIPEEIKNKIFEPFVSTKESSGIGIGLNVAKKIIDEHDGEIEAINQNNGACFIVKLITEKRDSDRRKEKLYVYDEHRINIRRKVDRS